MNCSPEMCQENNVKTQVTEWGENGSLFLQPRLQISTMGLRAEDF